MKKVSIIFTLALLLLFSFTVNCFAANISYTLKDGTEITIPEFPDGEPYTYVLAHDENLNWTHAWVSYVEGSYFKMSEYKNGYYYFLCYDADGNEIKFHKYGTGPQFDYWKDKYFTATASSISDNIYNNNLMLSTHDIKASDDTIFFTGTLPVGLMETIMELVAEKTPEVGTKTIQTMMIILLCGVGCLALLISYPLLARVLRRFLAG